LGGFGRGTGKSGGGDATESFYDEAGGDKQDSGASQVRQRGQVMEEGRSVDGSQDAGETTGALGHADGGALFTGRCEIGQQAEEGWAGQTGADGQYSQRGQQRKPGQAIVAEQDAQGEGRHTTDERQPCQAGGGKDETPGDELRLAQTLDQAADGPTLNAGTDHGAINEKAGSNG